MSTVRAIGVLAASVVLAVSLYLTYCVLFTPRGETAVMATAFSPYAVLGYTLSGIVLVLVVRGAAGRSRPVVIGCLVIALVGLTTHVVRLSPAYSWTDRDGDPELSVLTFNWAFGRADAEGLVELIEREKPDVAVFEEFTPAALDQLEELGIDRLLPHRGGQAANGAVGTMAFSRYRIVEPRPLAVTNGSWLLRVQAPLPFTLLAVHTARPGGSGLAELWRQDHRVQLRALRAIEGPVVAAGDFNATLEHRPMREYRQAGLTDAVTSAGAGWQPTWPARGTRPFGIPSLFAAVAIDHVLISEEFVAVSTQTHQLAATDHLALIARLRSRP